MVAFKVSRACAAAALGPAELPAALACMAQLQPLKYEHFALRERHMALQLREICASLHQQAAAKAGAPPGAAGRQPVGSGASSGAQGAGPPKRQRVVVVLGRQHVPGLRAMWGDASSALWRDRVKPTAFRASAVEGPAGQPHGGP